jgi:hypothetical protein
MERALLDGECSNGSAPNIANQTEDIAIGLIYFVTVLISVNVSYEKILL